MCGVYKGRPLKYHELAENPKDRLVFNNVSHQLYKAVPIRRIARDNGISKSTVYEIKKRIEVGIFSNG